jgi:hypothetical protein
MVELKREPKHVEIGFGYVYLEKFMGTTSKHVIIDVSSGDNFESCQMYGRNIGIMGSGKRDYIYKLTGQILSKEEIIKGIKQNNLGYISNEMIDLIENCSQKSPRMIG